MYSLNAINAMNAKVKAKHRGVRPLVAETDKQHLIGIPTIGDYVPRGWKLVDTLFVDSSGFGERGEPALTMDAFYDLVRAGFGYAVVEAGQFQVHVGIFQKK